MSSGQDDFLAPVGWEDRLLLIQHCQRCDRYQYYPRPFCSFCGTREPRLIESSGLGEVYSYTIVYREVSERFKAPYVLAIIRLEEGVHMLSQVVDVDPNDVRCEMAVRLHWDSAPDKEPLPLFVPV